MGIPFNMHLSKLKIKSDLERAVKVQTRIVY